MKIAPAPAVLLHVRGGNALDWLRQSAPVEDSQSPGPVYPVRPTRGVNRGYRDEYFRADGSSIVIQGAGTPTIYRGDRYPRAVQGNAFITDSPTNLVHQFVITDDGTGRLSAKNAYPRGEFFASSDERCRPVNLFSAPDGTMYIVDMYRGVVQAGGLWSDYLSDYIKSREMLLPVARGRIWRVVYGTGANRRGPAPSLSSAAPAQLVQTLSHPNGWWRDTAQRLLVERGDNSVVPALENLAASAPDWRAKLHALWTLDGLDAIQPASIDKAMNDASPEVRASAIRISERWLGDAVAPLVPRVLSLAADRNWNVRRQVAASIGALPASNRSNVALAILGRDGNDPIIVDAVVSSLSGLEGEVLDRVIRLGTTPPTSESVQMLTAAVAKAGDAAAVGRFAELAADGARPMPQRLAILRGLDAGLPASGGRGGRGPSAPLRAGGGGLPGLSPPGGRVAILPGRGVSLPTEPAALTRLALETGELPTLARAVVAKLNWTGKPAPAAPPVPPLNADEQRRFDAGKEVFANLCAGCHDATGQGKDKLGPSLLTSRYVQANSQIAIRIVAGGKEGPTGLMPPLAGTLSDAQIAAVITYIRREWGHTASPVTEIEVRELRQSTSWHTGPWTEAELSSMVAGGRGRGRGGAQ